MEVVLLTRWFRWATSVSRAIVDRLCQPATVEEESGSAPATADTVLRSDVNQLIADRLDWRSLANLIHALGPHVSVNEKLAADYLWYRLCAKKYTCGMRHDAPISRPDGLTWLQQLGLVRTAMERNERDVTQFWRTAYVHLSMAVRVGIVLAVSDILHRVGKSYDVRFREYDAYDRPMSTLAHDAEDYGVLDAHVKWNEKHRDVPSDAWRQAFADVPIKVVRDSRYTAIVAFSAQEIFLFKEENIFLLRAVDPGAALASPPLFAERRAQLLQQLFTEGSKFSVFVGEKNVPLMLEAMEHPVIKYLAKSENPLKAAGNTRLMEAFEPRDPSAPPRRLYAGHV